MHFKRSLPELVPACTSHQFSSSEAYWVSAIEGRMMSDGWFHYCARSEGLRVAAIWVL